ncbi:MULTISPECIES: thiol-activated cytolysin family protein [unclassified Deinococcus]|uniref:thiol-activated cytolysin family protein n=1 Tax=unclassified Deinococcus TaxID=2623546 RepID=UPI0009925607|nr:MULTISPECIES: thiol-activated cytolysin family protein [unclassified Deinococcus]OOV11988.1 hypothetical protein BXU09_18750 [Deinococcus sp. LM3]PIG97157.1 hypothetical protein AMD26_014165 [Deinococcus sp. UR1]
MNKRPALLALSVTLGLALSACNSSQAPAAPSVSKPQYLVPCEPYLMQSASQTVRAQSCGEPEPEPDPQPAAAPITLRSWDSLVEKAQRLNLSLAEAASPYSEAAVAYRAQQALQQSPLQAQGTYPVGASNPQDFVDRLFLGSPSVWAVTPPPDPIINPSDPCSPTIQTFTGANDPAISSLEEIPSTIWPGALYQGGKLSGGVGAMVSIPLSTDKRKPLTLESDTAFMQRTGITPDSGSVYTAIGELMRDTQTAWGGTDPSTVYFKVEEASSLRELSTKTKLNFSGFGTTAQATLDTSHNANESSVYVVFYQTLFNVAVTENGRPVNTLFNSTLSAADLEGLGMRNEVSTDNLPTFIKSVSYGRALVARYRSSKDVNELKAALNMKFQDGKPVNGSVDMSAHYKRIIDNSSVEVHAIGGPYSIQREAMKGEGWKTYFEKEELPLNTLKPISFALKRWDNNPVALSSTLKYVQRSCTGSPARIQFKVENRKGNTKIMLKRYGETNTTEIASVTDDGVVRVIDATPFLSRRGDEITIYSEIDKYGMFGTSRRDTKVTPIVDGQELGNMVSEEECGTCHSKNIGYLTVNSNNGLVERR